MLEEKYYTAGVEDSGRLKEGYYTLCVKLQYNQCEATKRVV